jgi:hypothetical protein
MEHMSSESVSVFISYSHADEAYRKDLGVALASLRDEEKVSEWHDRRIEGGEEWDDVIRRQLDKADVILMLLSADFIASDYIRKIEIPAAIERHYRGDAVVIPVFIRRFDYSSSAPYARLQGYPTNALPVDAWPKKDEAWFTVVQGVRAVVERILKDRQRKSEKLAAARLRYRTKAKELLADGIIDSIERDTLDELRADLQLPESDAAQIETEEAEPWRKKYTGKERYRKTLGKIVKEEFPLSPPKRESLDGRMRDLGLNAEDVRPIEAEVFAEAKAAAEAKSAAEARARDTEGRQEKPKPKVAEPAPAPRKVETPRTPTQSLLTALRTGEGLKIKNPTLQQIGDALRPFGPETENPFMILDRGTDLTYMQAMLHESLWSVEYQDGSLDKHFAASHPCTLEQLLQLCASFMAGEKSWRDSIEGMQWTRMKL